MEKYRFGLIAFLIGYVLLASALDVTIQVNGSVSDQTCNVKSSDLIKNVTFPDLDPKDFPAIGSYSNSQEVTVALENCTSSIKNLKYKFTGDGDDTDTTLLKIKGAANAGAGNVLATGLAIEIQDANKNIIPLNQTKSMGAVISGSTYDFKFYLRYKSVSATVTAGDASSIMYLDMYYE